MRLWRLCGILLFALLLTAAWGKSRLDEFEEDVNGGKPNTSQHDEHHHHDHDDDDDDDDDLLTGCVTSCCQAATDEACASCAHATGEAIAQGLFPLGEMSYLRVANPGAGATTYTPRKAGEPLLPLARFDLAYRYIDHDMTALDFRAEGGYGPLALHLSESHYRETRPVDTLDVLEVMASVRLSFQADAEIDPSLGILTLFGNDERSHLAVGLPILIHPHGAPLGLEFRPLWSDRMTDLDIGAYLHTRYLSAKAGYRAMFSTHTSLGGPYFGLTMHF
jgi:hypothetical protein